MFGLAVLAGFVAYATLAVACVALIVVITKGQRYRWWIRAPAIASVVALFVLIPNRNWERPLAYASLGELCSKQGGEAINRVAHGVDGVRFERNPGAIWLAQMGFKYGEWMQKENLWRIDAGDISSNPYRVEIAKARFAVQTQGDGYAELPWNILMHETKIVDLESKELLAYQRGFRYRDPKPSNIELAALPLTLIFPKQDCWFFDGPHIVARTLRPHGLGRRSP